MELSLSEGWNFYDVPAGNLDYKNPNKSPMIYNFRDQVVEVLPNFRVHPSNFSQSEVPITRGLDPNILFASANTYYSSTSFLAKVFMSLLMAVIAGLEVIVVRQHLYQIMAVIPDLE